MTLKLSLTEGKMKGRANGMENNNSNKNCCHLLRASYVSGTVQRALHLLIHFIL